MNTQQLILLIGELENVSLQLLDITLGNMNKDPETSLKISNANTDLVKVISVLNDHLEKQEIES